MPHPPLSPAFGEAVADDPAVASTAPGRQGLYDPRDEHDSCGVGFVVDIQGRRSHSIVRSALKALVNLSHRGACGCEANTGDGAGIMIQVPDAFLRKVAPFALPPEGEYGVGLVFLPKNAGARAEIERLFGQIVQEEGQRLLGWRDVPTDDWLLGPSAIAVEPVFRQIFVGRTPELAGPDARLRFERKLYVIRKRLEHAVDALGLAEEVRKTFYVVSLSCNTLIYKGMLTARQIESMFPDLIDPDLTTALAIVHQRFSTNTFPSWPLAHPYRYVAHNGEINTLRGNINWMRAREGLLKSDVLGDDLRKVLPIISEGGSDTATFDNVLEFLVMTGRSLPHAMLMMIPEPWSNHEEMSPALKAFYQYHASLMEPWDGPAAMAFSDGTMVGAILDRNGLRPSRYYVTRDGLVIMASEVGVLDIPPEDIVLKERLHPGRILLVDTARGRIVSDEEIKQELASAQPYAEWLAQNLIDIEDLPPVPYLPPLSHEAMLQRQLMFGYTREDLEMLLEPMATDGEEAIGSMGTDAALAALSDRPRPLFDYFQQIFAQVTNPPLDAIREELVTAMESTIGPEGNLLAPRPESCRQIEITYPVIDNGQTARLRHVYEPGFRSIRIPMLFDPRQGGRGLERAVEDLKRRASDLVAAGYNIILLSDRDADRHLAPIPSLLATAAVHHHLVRLGARTRCALVVEAGDAREVHHCALLLGYGAGAVNPYLAFETIDHMIRQGQLRGITYERALEHYVHALNKGILKVMSKMGISTLQSYCGAQVFEAVGLDHALIDRYFTWTPSRIGGVGIDVIAEEARRRHEAAFSSTEPKAVDLDRGGEYQWRRDGEYHLFNPDTVSTLQHATSSGQYSVFKEYSRLVDDQSRRLATIRGLFEFRPTAQPVPLDEVEPVESIVKRFSTGAMSYGSISQEAHETLAVAMNRLGAKSNSGEGGEDPARYTRDPNGDSRRSAIKQVASARFGVTSEYLVNAEDLQIKMAQGAKPGEGGQLPGLKVYPWIAKVRHATPGVGLISPPPHHDIYSIEDLAQLIYDLKSSNPKARIHVKLVALSGVGTVAAGVAKAHADVVLISGHDGGTGASPLTSIKHAGVPWELGLAETQQVLLLNRLRDRIVVQVDGQLKTGRDVVTAALLGAEEFGFATAPLVVLGCVMMRVCHLNTCPVGIATQDPELRKQFAGKPEHVENFFRFIAQEVREHLAALGFRTLEEAIGRTDRLNVRSAVDHWKARGLDLSAILEGPAVPPGAPRRRVREQDHGLQDALDNELITRAASALDDGTPVSMSLPIRNVHRTVGTMLGYEVTRRYGAEGLPEDTIRLHFTGSAGQSFGAFLPRGITLTLEGDSNDHIGKGLSGGKIIVFPPRASALVPEDNIIVGNVALYGATGGEAYFRGIAGERFAVRNSGAAAVVEGVGDHGCEYMTGGRVVVLGRTGRNFAAGMSGGTAYIWDPEGQFRRRCNPAMVDLERLEHVDDLHLVRDLVESHARYTGSERATAILRDWHEAAAHFVKVMPRDYKRVLQAQTEAEAAGKAFDFATVQRPPRMGKATGFMQILRAKPAARPVPERLHDWKECYLPTPPAVVREQATRCMDCGIPFCHNGCPLGNLIPDWNDLVYQDRWRAAFDRLMATNNFPDFTGRLCPAPCEPACVVGINREPVSIKSVEAAIIERAFDEGWVTPHRPARRSGKKVAVVGSGPAGLAAADQLNHAGHQVTVFERADRIGGLLRYGIPEFKLEKRVLDRRLALMSEEGVVFRPGCHVGVDLATDDLRRKFDAVVLAGGSTRPRDLKVPGRELAGIHFAMEYLAQQNHRCEGDAVADGVISAKDRHVVILGGGDTGADCLGTSLRQGARSVTQIELLPRPPAARAPNNPWPTWPNIFRVSSAHEEGGERVYSIATERFSGNGRVTTLHAVKVEPVTRNGRLDFDPVPGSGFDVPADLVLLAMGFVGPETGGMLDQLGVKMTDRGTVWRDAQWMTSVRGVFTAGDMQRGQSLVVWAIAEGRSCARAVDAYLGGASTLPAPLP